MHSKLPLAIAAIALLTTSAAAPAPQQGGYRYQVQDPVMPQSFYNWLSGRNLPIEKCNEIGNSPRMSALLEQGKQLAAQGTFGALRAVIVIDESAIVLMRQCEQDPQAKQQLDYFVNVRADAVRNCKQIASDPSACLAPFPWQ